MSRIIAVDFDGTIFTNAWPNIGEPINRTIIALKVEKLNGAKLILWTNRVGNELQEAVDACKEQGIEFDAVNDNLPEIVDKFGVNCRKVVATEYWDDRAVKADDYGIDNGVTYILADREGN